MQGWYRLVFFSEDRCFCPGALITTSLFEYAFVHAANRFRVPTLLKVLTFGVLLYLQNTQTPFELFRGPPGSRYVCHVFALFHISSSQFLQHRRHRLVPLPAIGRQPCRNRLASPRLKALERTEKRRYPQLKPKRTPKAKNERSPSGRPGSAQNTFVSCRHGFVHTI